MSTTQYEDYIVNGRNMNDLAPSVWTVPMGSDKFCKPSTMTQSAIQSFLVSKNSILQNNIEVWAYNSSKVKYNTGRVVTPSQIIYNAANTYSINPKVILATMQKESSLLGKTPGSIPFNDSSLIWAMGCGKTDTATYYSISGFDTQINTGASWLSNNWYEAYNLGQSAFPCLRTGINYGYNTSYNNPSHGAETYKNYIWVKNCGTYALYKYTPHTFDVKINNFYLGQGSPSYDSANYVFKSLMIQYWNDNWD
jgi:hypothetical protein